ncbi:hypothetical protein RHSIM_Rhsim11G0113700 [Rhododendron simsii]|uniref:Tyrosine-protein kinase catalytic domain-containing protein n=1 Tax=Rhododendron simsii TaxID=118357 RepID=A0A834G9Z4_RHOSS|nr:hypothetical protein RHSIM_Rhsim11G0113700 [Rhododendron simsii]
MALVTPVGFGSHVLTGSRQADAFCLNPMVCLLPSSALYGALHTYRDLNSNNFSGSIPPSIGNLSNLYVLDLTNNSLSGTIPVSSGTAPGLDKLLNTKHLRLDGNSLTGSVPSQFSNFTSVSVLYLSNNRLSGPIPNLSTMKYLNYVDLSNNTFDASVFPSWLSNLQSLTTILVGNPACTETGGTKTYCVIPPSNSSPYSTPPNNCIRHRCSSNKVSSPNCICAYPYTGTLIFRAPSFSNLRNNSIYTSLENSLTTCFNNAEYPVDSVSIRNPSKNTDNYLSISIEVFPYGQERFNRTGISRIAFALNRKIFTPPITYGTFSFQANPYNYFAEGNNSSNRGVITGAAVGGSVVLLLALLAGFYAFRQKRRAEKADRMNKPFASWDPNTTSGGVPLLKEARCFSYDELKKYANNFAEANRIGSGGYGKVYRGTLPNGQLVAIKRAQRGSVQGGLEFKTEIELLSRGYMDPEYYMTQKLTEKSDVYSFGVVLLELVTARQPIEKGKYIVREVREKMKRDQVLYSLDEILDPAILAPTPKGLEQFVDLAMRCVEEEGARRPIMGVVVKEIENVMQIAGLNPNADSTSTSATHEGDAERKPIERGKNIVWEFMVAMDNASGPSELLEILDPITGYGTSLACLKNFLDLAMSCVSEVSHNRPKMGEVVREIENIIQVAGSILNSQFVLFNLSSFEEETDGFDSSVSYVPFRVEGH